MRSRRLSMLLLVLLVSGAGLSLARADQSHVMVKGDTLWQVSRRYYGDPSLYDVLGTFNGIDDYRDIPVGKKILIPSDPSVLRKIKANPGAAAQIIADYKAGKKGNDGGDDQGNDTATATRPGGPVNMDALSVLSSPGRLPSNLGTKP